MLRDVIKHGIVYAALNASGIAIGVMVLPVYARVLPAEALGVQDLLLALASLVTLTAPLEVAQGLGRFYAEAHRGGERILLASTALWFTIGAEAVAVVALLALGPWLSPWILGPWDEPAWWLLIVGFVPAHGLYTLLVSQLRWRLQPVHYAVVVLIQTAAINGVGLWLAAGLGWSLPGLLIAYVAGYTVAAVLALLVSRTDYHFRFDRAVLGRMLAFSAPLVPSSVAFILYLNGDRLVLRQFLGLEVVGHYAVLTRFAFLVRPLLLAASMALTPLVVARHQDPQTPLAIARFCRYLWLGVLACILLLAAVGPELMSTLVTDRYAQNADLLPLLAGAAALGELYIVAPGLVIARRTQTIAIINIGSAVVNLTLNVLLVPIVGLAGACIATTFSAAVALYLNIHFSQRFYPIHYPWRAVAIAGAVSLAAATAAVAVGGSAPIWGAASLTMRAVLVLLGFGAAAACLLSMELEQAGGVRGAARWLLARRNV